MKVYKLITLFTIIFTSCQIAYKPEVDDHFMIKRKEALMPVWVRGKSDSDSILVILHGGPGGTNYFYLMQELFKDIEGKFLVTYYDQRGSGQSQGLVDPETFRIDELKEDVNLLLDTLKLKYGSKKIFLMGHSWGGFLGTYYLLDDTSQEKVTGWIEVNGAHNMIKTTALSREWVLANARDRAENPDEIIKWYEENETINLDNYMTHVRWVKKCNGYWFNKDYKQPEINSDYYYFSQFSHWLNLGNINKNPELTKERFNTQLSPLMKSIKIPSLILWGEQDGKIPVGMAYDAYDSLGASEENKEIILFPKSGHSPHYEENEEFNKRVISFMEKY